jgi:pyruvate kinase
MAVPEIICTIGPVTSEPESWRRLLAAGATGFRIPFAKETPDLQFERAGMLAAMRVEQPIRIYADLPGDAPRTANPAPVDLPAGPITLAAPEVAAGSNAVPVHGIDRVAAQVTVGTWLLLGDGEIGGPVREISGEHVVLELSTGGRLAQRRRVSWRGGDGATEPFGSYDLELLHDPRMANCTDIMLSFVSSAAAIKRAREEAGDRVDRVCAKVEDGRAIANLDELAGAADSLLIGQGDLLTSAGVEAFVQSVQRVVRWRQAPGAAGCPVFFGTGLLDGVAAGTPVRAELGYLAMLASAVDGIMLSAETTIGAQPEQAVRLARFAFDEARR